MNTVTGVLFPNLGLSNDTMLPLLTYVPVSSIVLLQMSVQLLQGQVSAHVNNNCSVDDRFTDFSPGGDPLYPSSLNDSHRNRFCLLSVLFLHDPLARHVSSSLPGMDEDGSFIGKYAKNRNPEQSSAFATLV